MKFNSVKEYQEWLEDNKKKAVPKKPAGRPKKNTTKQVKD